MPSKILNSVYLTAECGFEELFADDFVDHTPQPGTTPDKDGVRVLYKGLRDFCNRTLYRSTAPNALSVVF